MPVGSSDTAARPTDHKPHKYFGYDMYDMSTCRVILYGVSTSLFVAVRQLNRHKIYNELHRKVFNAFWY